MHFIRRHFGSRSGNGSSPGRDGLPASSLRVAPRDEMDGIKDINSAPPSYEDSQDSSLRIVLQSACELVPLLWPSASSSSSPTTRAPSAIQTPTPLYPQADGRPSIVSHIPKSKGGGSYMTPSLEERESDVTDVLAYLATAPCGGQPFIDRIRHMSDFYLAPHTAATTELSNSAGSTPLTANNVPSSSVAVAAGEDQKTGATSQNQSPSWTESQSQEYTGDSRLGVQPVSPWPAMGEKQLAVLQNVPGPRESAILVLCARVLEGYYAGLGHVDSTLAMVENATSTESAREKYDGTAEENQSQAKSGSESGSGPNPTPKAHTKTSLTQIAACGEENCGCCDYDAGVRAQPPAPAPVADPKNPFSSSSSSSYYPDPSSSPPCGCGHPRISHHPSSPSTTALGVARLLHRYTNWHPPAYAALGHRSSTGYRKRSLSKIRVCGAPGTNCPCRDYDKGRRTGRCERCGHYDNVHVAAHIWRGEQTSERRGDKARNGEIGAGLDQKGEWELSWILIENAYILLNQMDHLVT